jgi:hypothetical protein
MAAVSEGKGTPVAPTLAQTFSTNWNKYFVECWGSPQVDRCLGLKDEHSTLRKVLVVALTVLTAFVLAPLTIITYEALAAKIKSCTTKAGASPAPPASVAAASPTSSEALPPEAQLDPQTAREAQAALEAAAEEVFGGVMKAAASAAGKTPPALANLEATWAAPVEASDGEEEGDEPAPAAQAAAPKAKTPPPVDAAAPASPKTPQGSPSQQPSASSRSRRAVEGGTPGEQKRGARYVLPPKK